MMDELLVVSQRIVWWTVTEMQSCSCLSYHALCFPEGDESDEASLNLSIAKFSCQIHLPALMMLLSILTALLRLTAVFTA